MDAHGFQPILTLHQRQRHVEPRLGFLRTLWETYSMLTPPFKIVKMLENSYIYRLRKGGECPTGTGF